MNVLLPLSTLLTIIRFLAVMKIPFCPNAVRNTIIVFPSTATVAVDPIGLFFIELLTPAFYYCGRVFLTIHINWKADDFDVPLDIQIFC